MVKLDVYKAYNDNPAMLLYNGEQQKGGIEKSMSSDPGSPVRVVVTAVKKTRKRRKYSGNIIPY